MIYVTGDTHMFVNIDKLNEDSFPQQNQLTKDDYVIVCGDFGMVWNNNQQEIWWREWLSKKNFTTLFVDGNHENFDLLKTFPIEEKWGGKVQRITDSIYHLCRGQIFNIDGKKFFTMGGADSIDKAYREIGISWWPAELPSYAEYEEALANLEANKWEVDYILTHCAPYGVQQVIDPSFDINQLILFHEQIAHQTKFKEWYFGHYHIDKDFGRYHCLFNTIKPILGEAEEANAV